MALAASSSWSRRLARIACVASIVVPACVFAPAAWAGPVEDTNAQEAFKRGRTLLEANKYAEARVEFKRSLDFVDKAVTALNLAKCDEELGKMVTAYGEYTHALTLAKAEKNDERIKLATDGMARVEPQINHVVFTLPDEDRGAALTLDDSTTPIDAGAPIAIDPGAHTLTAKLAGHVDWSSPFTIKAEDKTTTVPVAVLEAIKGPDPIKPPPKTDPIPPTHTHKKKVEPGVSGWAVLGFTAGGVSLLTGLITGGVSLGMSGKLKDECTNSTCGPDHQGDLTTALGLANSANVLIPLGAVGIALGGVALAIDKPTDAAEDDKAPKEETRLQIAPGFIRIQQTF